MILATRKINAALIVIAVLTFSAFSYISLTHEGLKIDEINHHLPTLKYISEKGISEGILGEGYHSANTPLPYIITALPAKIFNMDITFRYARLINILTAGLFIFLLFYYIGWRIQYLVPLLIIIYYPYLLKTSFVYYQAIYGLLFFLLYLIFIKKESPVSWFLSGIFLSAAILSQQFYLTLIPFSIYVFYKEIGLDKSVIKDHSKLIIHLLPLLLPLYLFILWGGVTHHNYRHHSIAFSPTNITSILTILGFTFWPLFVSVLRDIINNKRMVYFISAAILLSVFFTPSWANGGGVDKISGMTFHGLEIVSELSPILKYLFQVILIISGLELCYQVSKSGNEKVLIIAGLFIIGFSFNVILTERHLLPLLLILFIALLPLQSKKLLYLWLPYQAVLGAVYFYYLFAYNNY